MKKSLLFYPNNNLTFDKLFVPVEIKKEICVVHFRLDDFNFQSNDGTGNIVHPSFYINEINNCDSSITTILIIVDKCKYEPEQKYIQKIVEKCNEFATNKGIKRNFLIQQGNILEDWNTIRCAKKVIASNSTFCWTACFFGWCCNNDTQIVYPNTNFYSHQYFQIQQPRWRSEDVQRINFLNFDYNSL